MAHGVTRDDLAGLTMRITITGSGTPMHVAGRAGPGVLITTPEIALQVDVGRGTTLRLADIGQPLTTLTAVLVTHHHSDHLVGLADLLMLRWLEDIDRIGQHPLPVVVPDGPAKSIVEGCLDVWQEEIEMRKAHSGRPGRPSAEIRAFPAPSTPDIVFEQDEVRISAISVRHEPVVPSVAYRFDAPSGSCVVSGDTAACAEVAGLATGADVLVHEAFLATALEPGELSDPEGLAAYHAGAAAVGALAARAGVDTLVLTHLIPPPSSADEEEGFRAAVRKSGFDGSVIVARDLSTVEVSR